ncbi:MAG: DUF1501 domain-containing protein [Ardenticatenaceae bacterium]|nr:DUF1501 domain-containing protein [Ardenticatenaceae bacterium]
MNKTGLSRREFLQATGAVGVLGASRSLFPNWMPRMAFRSQPNWSHPGDVLLCVFLRGGMDGLSAVVPYGDGANYYDARPTQRVLEPGSGWEAALDLNGYFGLHPSLAPLKELYDDGSLAIVHATGSIDPSRSHFDAMKFMEYGTPGEKYVGTGWIGRHLQAASWLNESPFRAVGMGLMIPDSLRGSVSSLAIKSITDFHFKGREDEARRLQQQLAQLYTVEAPTDLLGRQAGIVFDTIEMLQSLDAANYQPSNGAVYPDNEFGLGLRQVAQLIKANIGLEVATVDLGGWDTHEYQGTLDGGFDDLMGMLAQGLAAFYADVQEQMGNVTVVTMSEFGRRVGENASAGTDHGHGNMMFLLGGGVNGGQVFSRWPSLAPEALDDGDLAITTDYRSVLAEIVQKRLLNTAVSEVFPNFTPEDLGLFRNR